MLLPRPRIKGPRFSKESDLKISGKEIYFGLLLKIQDLVNKRARSSKGEIRDHYSYLAFEINRTLANM